MIVELKETWRTIGKKTFENSQKIHEINKKKIDKKKKTTTIAVSDLVYVSHGNRLNRSKLDGFRCGPFQILKKFSNSIYKIDSGFRETEFNYFHVFKLHPSFF